MVVGFGHLAPQSDLASPFTEEEVAAAVAQTSCFWWTWERTTYSDLQSSQDVDRSRAVPYPGLELS